MEHIASWWPRVNTEKFRVMCHYQNAGQNHDLLNANKFYENVKKGKVVPVHN